MSRSNRGGRNIASPPSVTNRSRWPRIEGSNFLEVDEDQNQPKTRRPRDPRRIRKVQLRVPSRNPMIHVDRPTGKRELRTPVYEPDEYVFDELPNYEEDEDAE